MPSLSPIAPASTRAEKPDRDHTFVEVPLQLGKVALLDSNLKMNDVILRSTIKASPSPGRGVRLLDLDISRTVSRARNSPNAGGLGDEKRANNSVEANHDDVQVPRARSVVGANQRVGVR